MNNGPPLRLGSWLRSRTGLVVFGFLAIAAFFLITEHTAHVFGVLPYVLLLLCPVLHLLLHSGHGAHGGHGPHQEEPESHEQHAQGAKE